MHSSQFSLRSLLTVTGLIAMFLGFSKVFWLAEVQAGHHFPDGLLDSLLVLAIAVPGAFTKSDIWFIVALASSASVILLNVFVVEGWWRSGSPHWWLSQPSFGFALFAMLNRLSVFLRDKNRDWLIKTSSICLAAAAFSIALVAVSNSMWLSFTTVHNQTLIHLEYLRRFAGCLAYTVVLVVVWEWTKKNTTSKT
ncbi:MAG TPA: hypothetical protein VMY42_11585 [Thermoguttaceae bacterium]|nr:hypothetical protein [Thermoguttaceae bacterium]